MKFDNARIEKTSYKAQSSTSWSSTMQCSTAGDR
jgi:hypothetical protein